MSLLLSRQAAKPFNPRSVGAMDLWFDASALDGADNSTVNTWLDQSGKGRHITAPASGNRPILKRGILNGHPVVRFDGTHPDCLAVPFTALPHARTWLIVASLAPAATSVTALLFDGWRDGVATPTGRQSLMVDDTPKTVDMYAGTQQPLGSLLAPQATAIWSLAFNGASSAAWRNGTSQAIAGSTNTQGLHGFVLGSRYTATLGQAADVATVMAFTGVLATAARRRVESYLSAKYGIAVA